MRILGTLTDDTVNLFTNQVGCSQISRRIHKSEVIYLETKLMRSRERFRYYNKDFEICKVLKLRNCGNNGKKFEQLRKNLGKFF